MWLSVIAGINTLSTIASKSHVLLEVTHCSYVIPQFMFEPAHKCCISCLWFCLCNLVQEFQLVAPRTYQCSDVNTSSSKDFSCFLLSCWPYDQPRLWSVWVTPQLRTFLDLFNYGISYSEKFSIHSVQYDTDALILAFSWLQIIKVRPDLLLDWWHMLILVQQTLIYRISNHVLGTAMIIQCTYQMKIGKIATFFLYFVTKTLKIQFVLSFLSNIALGGTGTVFQDYFQFILCSYLSEIFSNFGFLGLASTFGRAKRSLRD